MTDEQPGARTPAAGTSDHTATPDPTRIEPDGGGAPAGTAARTADVPVRWSGSAAVPPPAPKRSRLPRLRRPDRATEPPATPAAGPAIGGPPTGEPDHWADTPAVDPWAGQDTPWPTGFGEPLPPTRIDTPSAALPAAPVPPPTRIDGPPRTDRATPAPPTGRPTSPPQTSPPQTSAPQTSAPQTSPPRTSAPQTSAPRSAPSAASPQSASDQPAAPRRGWWRRPAPDRPQPALPPQAPPRQPTAPARRPPAPPRLPAPRQDRRPAPPPRRKRRWPRRLALFTLLSGLCCCGVPAYLAWPAARQYPVSAVLPASFADLDLRDDGSSRQAVERLSGQLRDTGAVADQAFAGVYADGAGKRVTVVGTTGFRATPQSDVEGQLQALTAEFDLREPQSYDLGETGVHERCAAGPTVVVCAWADHGSLATVLLTRRSVPESAELVGRLRSAVLTRG